MRFGNVCMRLMVLSLVVLLAGQARGDDEGAAQVVHNADFSAVGPNDLPVGWTLTNRWAPEIVEMMKEDERTFVRFTFEQPGQGSQALVQEVPLDPSWKQVRITATLRARDVVAGENPNFNVPRVQADFRDLDGERTGPWIASPRLSEDADWTVIETTEQVPEQAATLTLRPGMWQTGGVFDVAEVTVHVLEIDEENRRPVQAPRVDLARRQMPAEVPDEYGPYIDVTGAEVDESAVEVVLHVAAEHPQADDAHDGLDADRPLRSIGAAMERAWDEHLPAGRGTKISIGPGTYREMIGQWQATEQAARDAVLVIEGSGPGEVIVSGAKPADDWTERDGVYERPWPHNWGTASAWGDHGGRTAMLGQRREIVFFADQRLEQVADRDELVPGSFFVDEGQRDAPDGTLYVKPPAGQSFDEASVELSMLPTNVDVQRDDEGQWRLPWQDNWMLKITDKDNLVIRNLVFERANTRMGQAALQIGWHLNETMRNVLIEHCEFRDNNATGMIFTSIEAITVRDIVSHRNGNSGMTCGGIENLILERVAGNENNWRAGGYGGLHGWAVGGIKMHRFTNAIIRDSEFNDNQAPGFWTDIPCTYFIVENVQASGNRIGLLIELSRMATLRNCIAEDNYEGLRIHGSADVKLENSRLMNNAVAITVYNDHRSSWPAHDVDADWFTGTDLVPRNWTLRDTVIGFDEWPDLEGALQGIPQWLQLRSLDHPMILHLSDAEVAEQFHATLTVENIDWRVPSDLPVFVGPSGQRLPLDAWRAAIDEQ